MTSEHDPNDKESKKPRDDLRLLAEAERERWILEKWDELPEVFSVEEAAKRLGVSRSTGYALTADGTLRYLRLRGCKRITRFDLFILLVRGCEGDAA